MLTTGQIVGLILLAAGVGISAATFLHDLRRWRVTRELPQAAPGRVMPEVHAAAALLSGAGVRLLAGGWLWALGAAVLHVALCYGVIRPRIEGD